MKRTMSFWYFVMEGCGQVPRIRKRFGRFAFQPVDENSRRLESKFPLFYHLADERLHTHKKKPEFRFPNIIAKHTPYR